MQKKKKKIRRSKKNENSLQIPDTIARHDYFNIKIRSDPSISTIYIEFLVNVEENMYS